MEDSTFDYDLTLRSALISQYLSALDMMKKCIESCPKDLWLNGEFVNPFWRVVYHSLFYFRLYLFQHLNDHSPWEQHRQGAQNMTLDPDTTDVVPYTREQMLDFVDHCQVLVDDSVSRMDLTADDCGFHWYQVSKLEHMLVNLRHLQHHIAQLQDRLRNHKAQGIGWTRSLSEVTNWIENR